MSNNFNKKNDESLKKERDIKIIKVEIIVKQKQTKTEKRSLNRHAYGMCDDAFINMMMRQKVQFSSPLHYLLNENLLFIDNSQSI